MGPSVDVASQDAPSKIRPSPFLNTETTTEAGTLAILHLNRDRSLSTILAEHDAENEGYDEGKVTNTRYGSYPHSTLIGLPWGSQVRASEVDTGSRGRKVTGQKRKREEVASSSDTATPIANASVTTPKAAKVAETGFIHIIPPTPEIWTMSLPHRTQVVYTPDYSVVLQRLRALPGTQLIEAGAGSGSFTHAAARAVFNGYPNETSKRRGKVWSFEFHETRFQTLQEEVRDHRLQGVVEVNHRDVYENGFTVMSAAGEQQVQATSVFLDLPAPWLALPQLTRRMPRSGSVNEGTSEAPQMNQSSTIEGTTFSQSRGPLADAPVHICCFLPCIEQVQRTVTTLKSLGWQELSVIEVAARRVEIRRERVGIMEEGLRGVNATPASVDEALIKLREAEARTRIYNRGMGAKRTNDKTGDASEQVEPDNDTEPKVKSKQERLLEIQEESERRKLFKEGKLIHKAEPELKTHTSYLIFAILPREWTEEDELLAKAGTAKA